MEGKHVVLALIENFTLPALRNYDHLHIYCFLCHLPQLMVLALQEDAGLTSPVLWGDAVPPGQPGGTRGLGVSSMGRGHLVAVRAEVGMKGGTNWAGMKLRKGLAAPKQSNKACRNRQVASVSHMRAEGHEVHFGYPLCPTLQHL